MLGSTYKKTHQRGLVRYILKAAKRLSLVAL